MFDALHLMHPVGSSLVLPRGLPDVWTSSVLLLWCSRRGASNEAQKEGLRYSV